jgi:long-chain fatty acid transport protein
MTGTKRWITMAAILMVAGTAFGAGFNIYEAGAKATALGGAFTATADDGSAIFYNPAGLAFLEGSALDLNLMPILPGAEFTSAAKPDGSYVSGKTVDQTFPIPGVYYYKNTGDFTFGFGLYAPFGMGVEWADPETWIGRKLSYNVDLKTIYVTPALAWKVDDKVAISFGLDIAYTEIILHRFKTQAFGGDVTEYNVIDATIEGTSDINYTPTAGLMIKATDKLTLGASYHHEKKMAIRDGLMTLDNVAPGALEGAVDGIIDGLGGAEHNGTTDLNLPHMLSLAAAYQLNDKARVEVDFVHFGWSTFKELALDFGNPALDAVIEEEYEDVWQIRAGLSYQLTPELTSLFGYVYDKTPQPVESMSPLLPDANRNDYSFGLAYNVNDNWTVTGTYMSVNFDERTNVIDGEQAVFPSEAGDDMWDRANPPGSYDSFANIYGLGIGYRF